MDLFLELLKIKTFEFQSQAGKKSRTGWNGYGTGTVGLQNKNGTLYFKENGNFKLDSSRQNIKIANEYIWQKINYNEVSLSHARFGYNNLVKLFDLVKVDKTYWQSKQEHVCQDDLYSAQLSILKDHIKLIWRITGPKKDETITYKYFF